MSSIERAKAVVNRLRQPSDPAICPHCGYGDTKRFGAYPRTIRDLGGVRVERQQRSWCHRCQRTSTPQRPDVAPYQRYAHRLQRKALDLRLQLGGSLRRVAAWLHAEIAPGSGRCHRRAGPWGPNDAAPDWRGGPWRDWTRAAAAR